ncbi:MAG: hypothetical protein AB2733_20050 [Candidatus Thiodiazotropha taylori]
MPNAPDRPVWRIEPTGASQDGPGRFLVIDGSLPGCGLRITASLEDKRLVMLPDEIGATPDT